MGGLHIGTLRKGYFVADHSVSLLRKDFIVEFENFNWISRMEEA